MLEVPFDGKAEPFRVAKLIVWRGSSLCSLPLLLLKEEAGEFDRDRSNGDESEEGDKWAMNGSEIGEEAAAGWPPEALVELSAASPAR